jgi:hypothetical protein
MGEHSPWDELAVGLALGALEPEDEQTFVAHLAGCPQCVQTISDIEAVAGQLAYAVPAEEPPPELLESIMREVRTSGRAVTPLRRMPDVARFRSRRAPARPARAARASGWESSWLTRAAVLLLVLSLAGWNYKLRAENTLKQKSLNNAAQVARLLTDPATKSVELTSAGKERAAVLVNGAEAYIVVDNFARNDSENTIYVLWAQNTGSTAMHGVEKFKVVHDGATIIPVRHQLDDSGAITAFAVSKEAGSAIPATPNTPIVIGTTTAST